MFACLGGTVRAPAASLTGPYQATAEFHAGGFGSAITNSEALYRSLSKPSTGCQGCQYRVATLTPGTGCTASREVERLGTTAEKRTTSASSKSKQAAAAAKQQAAATAEQGRNIMFPEALYN